MFYNISLSPFSIRLLFNVSFPAVFKVVLIVHLVAVASRVKTTATKGALTTVAGVGQPPRHSINYHQCSAGDTGSDP